MNTQNTEYVESLRTHLALGLHQANPGLTKQACEQVVEDILSAHPDLPFIKQASLSSMLASPIAQHTVGGVLKESLAQTAGKAGIGLMVGAGLLALNKIKGSADNEIMLSRARSALQRILASNDSSSQIIKSAPRDRIEKLMATIFNFAPSVASDEVMLKTLLATYANSDGTLDPSTIRSIQDIEEKHQKMGGFKPGDIAFKG